MTGDYRPVSKASSADASQVLWESAKEKDAAQRGGGGQGREGRTGPEGRAPELGIPGEVGVFWTERRARGTVPTETQICDKG